MSSMATIKIEQEPQMYGSQIKNNAKGPFLIHQDTLTSGKCSPKISEWTLIENARYAAFIENNCEKMEGQPHGKLWGLYQEMAKLVESRNFRQCKLHHQKLTNQIGTIPQIISYFTENLLQFEDALVLEREKFMRKQHKKVNRIACQQMSKGDKEDEKPTDVAYRNDAETENMSNYGLNFSVMKMKKSNQREQKWRQCHKYFMEWTMRLKQLVEPQIFY